MHCPYKISPTICSISETRCNRYWAPDYEGWYAMSMFEFSNKKGTAKSILLNHKTLVGN